MNDYDSVNIADWGEKDLEDFIRNNSSLFFAFAYRYMKQQDEIEDLIQDCYIKLWNDRKRIKQLASPTNFVFTMIKNNALNRIHRNHKMNIGIETDFGDTAHFYTTMIEAESSKILSDAVRSLSPQSQIVLDLLLQGKNLNEIAEELNISTSSVKTIKYRALEKLSTILPKKLLTIFF